MKENIRKRKDIEKDKKFNISNLHEGKKNTQWVSMTLLCCISSEQ